MNGWIWESRVKADGIRGEGEFWDDTSLFVIHIVRGKF